MAKSSTFYPAPNFAAPVISVRLYGRVEFGADWRALKEEIAERIECDADGETLIAQVRKAARDRAFVSIN